ncbi:MAG: hypothetical protein CMD50_00505 [Gammaproteobacteria bacterium]|nr:hypothetical protein [Gammaproteobacteria bacterium]
MNKIYAFCALVFLTACGSPDLDGTWDGVSDEVKNTTLEITGDKAMFTIKFGNIVKNVISCDVSIDNNESKLLCDEGGRTATVVLSMNGDNMTVTPDGSMAATFVRN